MKPGDIVKDVFITADLLVLFGGLVKFFNEGRPEHSFPNLDSHWNIKNTNSNDAEKHHVATQYMAFFGLVEEFDTKDEGVYKNTAYQLTDLGKSLYSIYLLTREGK